MTELAGILWSVLAFLVAISVLVTIHEYGHFWMARHMGVRVLRFSVGFGRPLWSWHGRDGTEYAIAAIPFGGYVKLLDEREGEVPEELRDQAFNRKPVWQRMAIVAAGPTANFLLAIVLYALMYMIGVQGIRPYVGHVTPGSIAAQAGLAPQDLILAVDGRKVESWQQARMAMLEDSLGGNGITLDLKTPAGTVEKRVLDVRSLNILKSKPEVLHRLGLSIWRPSIPIILKALPGGAAARAGLHRGDRIVAVNGQPVVSVASWIQEIKTHPGKPLVFLIERGGKQKQITVVPSVRQVNGKAEGFIDAQVEGFIPPEYRKRLQVTVKYGPGEALLQGAQQTWSMAVLTFQVLGRMIIGQASLSNLSGPVTIAEYAGISAAIGISAFLGFLAIVSVSLGVLNFLPVPLLDGGQLFYLAIEFVRGQPLSEAAQIAGQKIGIILLSALMALAFYNDIHRLLG